jgi:tetratricopeptide (TPR) repeat protein
MNIAIFRNTSRFRLNSLALLVTLLLAAGLLTTLPGWANAQSLQQAGASVGEVGDQQQVQQTDKQVQQTLLSGFAQVEIVKGLVEQGRFDQVLPEMRKLFALDLPDNEEHRIAESAAVIANLLVERKQFALAHQVLDEAFTRMNRNTDKASVLKIKAWVYKEEGQLDKAVETYDQALALEKKK